MTDTPQDCADARRLLLADGECSPNLPLPAMVRRVIEQRDRARWALLHLRGLTGPRVLVDPATCGDCADVADLTKGAVL
jgi:hypothetical protein